MRIVTSFAVSPGTRCRRPLDLGSGGSPSRLHPLARRQHCGCRIWRTSQRSLPPTARRRAGDAKAYGRDFKMFREFSNRLRLEHDPRARLDRRPSSAPASGMAISGFFAASGGGVDGFSYHHYNTVSRRCGWPGRTRQVPLRRVVRPNRPDLAFYRSSLRPAGAAKAALLTETAAAACGGNPWDATLKVFRYLDQLERLAAAVFRQSSLHNDKVI